MNKLIVCLIIGLFLTSIFLVVISNLELKKPKVTSGKVYLGAVPEGYDLEYFSKTGITKKLGG